MARSLPGVRASRTTGRLLGAAAVVVVVAVVTAITVLQVRDGVADPAPAPSPTTAQGGYVVGDPDAAVVVEVVEDFQCPACREFEALNAALLARVAAGGDVAVEYRGTAVLDDASSTSYSTRALNASACVMAEGPDTWKSFHDALFAAQPPEDGAGLPDEVLVDLAVDAGADGDAVGTCVDELRFGEWVAEVTAGAGGAGAVPTVRVDGQVLRSTAPADLQAAIDEAVAAAGAAR